PAFVERSARFLVYDLDIPANAADSRFSARFTNWSDTTATIASITGHMHLLGTSIDAHVVSPDGERTCGLSIPDWDFDWQLYYRMPAGSGPLTVSPGDSVEISCAYDNSPSNQPVVEGVRQEPRDVEWGEGSLDEMCLVGATLVEPYQPSPATQGGLSCSAANECFLDGGATLSSLMECEDAGTECVLCSLQSGVDCGLGLCAFLLTTAQDCFIECGASVAAFGGSFARCLGETCSDAYQSLVACADPVFESGACDEALYASCGLGTDP
ncbi:MAG: hypothetical protein AAFQ82_07365, partial [Myxococcota bacterium]